MSAQRVIFASLAMVLAMPAPSLGQTPGSGPSGRPPQSQGSQPQRTQPQPQRTQPQPQRAQQPQPTSQTRREPAQTERRDRSGLPAYGGQDSYRPGKQPPLVQRNHDGGRDRETYRKIYRSEHHYRVRPYVRPRGWYSHDWILGEILPSLFWTRSYWIVQYWLYDLPIPPVGCIWVRYGDDALLIDQRTGEVIMVIYDIFYY